MEMQTG